MIEELLRILAVPGRWLSSGLLPPGFCGTKIALEEWRAVVVLAEGDISCCLTCLKVEWEGRDQ